MSDIGRPIESSFRIDALGSGVRAYLRQISDGKGEGVPGVYTPDSHGTPGCGYAFAILFFASGALFYMPDWDPHPIAQGVFFALSALAVYVTTRRWQQTHGPNFMGIFRFFDAHYVWTVLADRVDVLRLETVSEVVNNPIYQNKVYMVSNVIFKFEDGSEVKVPVGGEELGQRAANLTHSAVQLRRNAPDDVKAMFTRDPELLAAMAANKAADKSMELADIERGPKIPDVPVPSPSDTPRSRRWLWVLAGAVFALSYFINPMIHEWVRGLFAE